MTPREVTLEELNQMLLRGEISSNQYIKILKDNLGTQKLMDCLSETFKEVYRDLKPEDKNDP